MINARYSDAGHTTIAAVIDGVEWSGVRLDADGEIHDKVKAWVAEGGAVAPFEPPPEPRRAVPKSVIVRRLHRAGKLEAAKAALAADTLLHELWYAADLTAIYADDENALALLGAIGADAGAILAQ